MNFVWRWIQRYSEITFPLQSFLFLNMEFLGPCCLVQSVQWYYICLPNGSTPSIWEGFHLLPTLPSKWDYLCVTEAKHYSDLPQPSSSPLEEEAENEQATNFLLVTETELLTTVFSNKWGDTWHPHQFTNYRISKSWSTLRAGLSKPSRDTSCSRKINTHPSPWSITYSERTRSGC